MAMELMELSGLIHCFPTCGVTLDKCPLLSEPQFTHQ